MFLQRTLDTYLANKQTAIVFGVLLVLAAALLQFSGVFASSATIFWEYDPVGGFPFGGVAQVALFVLFVALYASFVSIVVFGARNALVSVKMNLYLSDLLRKFAARLFVFYLVLLGALIGIGMVGSRAGVDPAWFNALFLVVTLFTVFVPQAVVVEEKGLRRAIWHNFAFIRNHFADFVYVALISFLLVLALPILEFALDGVSVGAYVTLVLMTVFVVPFVECLKTQLYMRRFGLVQGRMEFERRHKIKAGF